VEGAGELARKRRRGCNGGRACESGEWSAGVRGEGIVLSGCPSVPLMLRFLPAAACPPLSLSWPPLPFALSAPAPGTCLLPSKNKKERASSLSLLLPTGSPFLGEQFNLKPKI
jgi:hypothetical protein